MAFALSPEREARVDELLKRYPTKRAACIPVLHICQEQNGWCSPDVIEYVAKRLEIATSIVTGVVTFYTMFHQQPVGKHVIYVCRTLSCEIRGGKELQDHLEKRLGCKVGGTSADGRYSLRKAECLAACGQAPMIQIDENYYENLTPESLDRILEEHPKQPAPRPATAKDVW